MLQKSWWTAHIEKIKDWGGYAAWTGKRGIWGILEPKKGTEQV